MGNKTSKRLRFGLTAGLVVAVVAACGRGSSEEDGERAEVAAGSYPRIAPERLAGLMDADPDLTVVNVHIPCAGEIPGTDAFVPFTAMETFEGQTGVAPDSPVVVYCRSGNMSAQAAEVLVELGYTNVLDLRGGMVAWEDAGYTLTKLGS
ncbi:MAG: rhodanese-like domain-containing protein [Dehalococcoidia bacterium]